MPEASLRNTIMKMAWYLLAPVLADFPLSANCPPQVNRVQYRALVDAANLHLVSIVLQISSTFTDLEWVHAEILRIAREIENAENTSSGLATKRPRVMEARSGSRNHQS